MLTDFGRFLRKIRIDYGEILKDMAEKLDVTASFLSAVETGKRNIPEHWLDKISKIYNLDKSTQHQMKIAATNSVRMIKINLEKSKSNKRETAILFAREFEIIDDETINKIHKLLLKDSKEEN